MIRSEKLANAFYALNDVLVLARAMAYADRDRGDLAAVLDVAEHLPRLIAEHEDRTALFRECLVDLALKNPDFQHAVDRFDNEVPARW